jgi:hypothetical protein
MEYSDTINGATFAAAVSLAQALQSERRECERNHLLTRWFRKHAEQHRIFAWLTAIATRATFDGDTSNSDAAASAARSGQPHR